MVLLITSGGGAEEDSRTVHCNRPDHGALFSYPGNKTSTRKYTWWNFVPLALFVQYRRAAYWYFTAMAGLSLAPFAPYSPVSVWLPLIFVLVLGLLREAWEDARRGRGDKELNNRAIDVHDGSGHFVEKKWRDLRVGDLVRVRDGDYFPSDLLLISSTGTDGMCYVETMNLDGETNLKVRQALEVTWGIDGKDENKLRGFKAELLCEAPNASLYTFSGRLKIDETEPPVGPPQLLLRDSSLQNTGTILGVVVYTGHDTKSMQNATPPPTKRSRVDRSLDKVIWLMFLVLLAMATLTALVLALRTKAEGTNLWYMRPTEDNPYYNPNNAAVAGIVGFFSGLVLYGYLIPIALYVSLEIVRVAQALFMVHDMHMYDPATDKRARVKSPGLNEELGQVDTIFSDKTGTLTSNQMDFFRCTIQGVSYGKGSTEVERAAVKLGMPMGPSPRDPKHENVDESNLETGPDNNPYKQKGFNFYDERLLGCKWLDERNSEGIRFFFEILALCHTAIPEGTPEDPDGMRYRAESPDEAALVVAAKQFGFYFYKRTPTTLHIRETLRSSDPPKDQVYQLLNVLEFSSLRKRMSVIVRFPDGRLLLLSKGADSVIFQRVGRKNGGPIRETTRHLKQFGEVGLRTLVVAYKELDEDEYESWQKNFAEARSLIGKERESRTEELAEEIEQGLTVVGGTGVEDKLQVGVPEAVDRLARAGINIWVLTGDKVETAINIGYACSLLRQGMDNLIVSLESAGARAIDEKAERENWSRGKKFEKQKEFVAKKLSDALELVLGGHANPRGTSTSERNTSFSESLQSALSRSLSKNSATLARNLSNSSATLARNLSTPSARHSRHPSAGQKVFEMLPLVDGQEVGVNGEGLDQRERAYSKENVVTRSRRARPAEPIDYALVIDGQSLTFILAEEELQELFLKVCINCSSVLCCRVSPRQKAQVTTLVRKGLGQHRLCLAIGDGANDVGMIQAANVGVGILGVEGAQAAMAADFAIGQFRFLERLLLVHGRWCYRRVSLMILYFFYKVCIMGWISFFSNIFTYFSGNPLYNDWYASFYNTVFTALPIIVIGILDQDVTPVEAFRYPQLYQSGQRGELFNKRLIIWWLANSLYAAAVIFFFPLLIYSGLSAIRPGGQVAAAQEFGAAMFTVLVLVPNLQIYTAFHYFTWIHHVAIWASIVSWYLFIIIYGALPVGYSTIAYREFVEVLAPSATYWLLQPLVVMAALLPDLMLRSAKTAYYPPDYQIVIEHTNRGTEHPAQA
ncbi:probable phospholipid-transporting ATPase 8 isoform X2 [Physcomitrium patens]|uniref:probable phospholipid-transporting ATPase 8 isoform X2 n=1 Tax=Physcomitrium patens TaxID=3218 RepID=UPI000D15CFD7|nr:putative phospholipid-transporting ATPase 9 isoform X2 [Physcomitrium patens]|eukprot:XP_024362425.1 putative phospholipid-transporting ATPase 9 isoform X2 [Physcomitrella patens]